MNQENSQSAKLNPAGGSRDELPRELAEVVLVRLIFATAVLTALAWIVGGWQAWHQTRQLRELESAWAPNQATYERLVTAHRDLVETRRTLDELYGSWQCPLDCGSLVRTLSFQAPDAVEIAKIRLESTLTYDRQASETSARDVPLHEFSMTVAGRCYADDAPDRILDFQNRLEQEDEVVGLFPHIAQEGTQRIEGRGEDSRPAHTVFGLHLSGSPHPLVLRGPEP